ncbi:hypothetical protein [Lentzea flaviverrucosa]|uniref:hypothetical protein n=1 Tax=Lentzea flaviverrucosa TaxID=200379 RepID=UPI001160980A|nr:hypothetical protein [Lentzea flaviverrucosa]
MRRAAIGQFLAVATSEETGGPADHEDSENHKRCGETESPRAELSVPVDVAPDLLDEVVFLVPAALQRPVQLRRHGLDRGGL